MRLHIKNSFENIRRAPFQAMAAVSVLAITFFVSTLIAVAVYSSSQLLRYFETRPQVIAFLAEETDQDQIDELLSRLNDDYRILNPKFVSKEDALQIYKDATADNPLLGEFVSPGSLPASIEFAPAELEYAQELIEEMQGELIVEDVGFTASVGGVAAVTEVIERLKTISEYIRLAGGVSTLVLATTSFLVLVVVISMRTSMKRDEIEALSLIGATSGFIRAPLVLEAIHYAVIGVFLGWLVASSVVMYASPTIFSYFGDISVLPANMQDFLMLLGFILAGQLVIGIFIALLGSNFAVSRNLKLK